MLTIYSSDTEYPQYNTTTAKNHVSYFTSLTLISEPPTFLTRGGGVPGFNDDDDEDDDEDDDDGRGRGRGRGYRGAITHIDYVKFEQLIKLVMSTSSLKMKEENIFM
jgi:hypothetical protein